MEAIIVNFRIARHNQKTSHLILKVSGVSSKDKAASLIGKEVVWTSSGKLKKQIKGKIAAAHGNSGAVRAIMERGLPGQSLGKKIEIK